MPQNYDDIKKAQAIEQQNKEKFLRLNPSLNDNSGIYLLLRRDENGIRYFYCGQAKHILTRLAQHMTGYQHIDLSLKKRGLYSLKNPFGYFVSFQNCREEQLDAMEQYWILELTKRGYQCRYNKTAGGQGQGKERINEFRQARTYTEGMHQGRQRLADELAEIADKYLQISVKPEKAGSKRAENMLNKFLTLIHLHNNTEK